jgi:aminopeptidase-like protein
MYKLAQELWPYNRSITGNGVRSTLLAVKELLPELRIIEVPTGTKAFDWIVPKEWNVKSAYIETPDGRRICEYSKNNLHLVGYSSPIKTSLDLRDLKKHLHSIPDKPDAIPYITSYYRNQWGFCISENEKRTLQDGKYNVVIESEFFEGALTYGELIIRGKSRDEVFLSTYICHPSMANNELSGPCVTVFLALSLLKKRKLNYSYRIVFVPETIGSITYLSRNLKKLKKYVFAGYNITCVGDERAYSYLPTRCGNTLSDNVAKHVLSREVGDYVAYEWRDRGSDERQYCWPGVDLPIASIMRTKYGAYDEYHTSLDTLGGVVTPNGLLGAYNVLSKALHIIDNHFYPIATTLCEPFLSRRNLYAELGNDVTVSDARLLVDILSWCDGKHSVLEISEITKCYALTIIERLETLAKFGLVNLGRKKCLSNQMNIAGY